MIDLRPLKNRIGDKKIAIAGLGKSGMPVYQACAAAGIETVLWDDNVDQRQKAAEAGAAVHELTTDVLKACAFLCLSPGIPLTYPQPHVVVLAAQAAGIDIIGDVEMFHMARPDARVIGITGTNGKSTTTALIGHILKTAGKKHAVGGNIGEAVLSLPDLDQDAIYVLELSSYQIDLLKDFRPDIAVHTNFSTDHLDRHGDMDSYVAVKEKLFDGAGVGITGIDDPYSFKMLERLRGRNTRRSIPVSVKRPLMTGVYASTEGTLFDGVQKILNLETCPALMGDHNRQNAALAYAACRAVGVAPAQIVKGLQSFPGLRHRQNLVATIGNVSFVNDSKATNDDAAAVALKTYPSIYWIAGGSSKNAGYAACEKELRHVRHAFLIGAAQDEIAAWLQSRKIPYTSCGTLDKAVTEAYQKAARDPGKSVILLSPACASFDQYSGFEQRGDAFSDLVLQLQQRKAS